jgi:signal transduction histidine kinase
MRMLTETASEVRKTAHNLMPDVLIRYDLEKALTLYADDINTSNLLQIDMEFYGALNELNKAMELIVYRMAQELIQNIIKHANASLATIAIMLHENKLSITAEDNGTGFNVSKSNMGFGLQNLQHRVEALHGNIDIQSAEESPTVIFIVFDFTKFKEMAL